MAIGLDDDHPCGVVASEKEILESISDVLSARQHAYPCAVHNSGHQVSAFAGAEFLLAPGLQVFRRGDSQMSQKQDDSICYSG